VILVAIGIALDHYHYADASTRHGTSNPFENYQDEVLALAREILRCAPSPMSERVEQGANHASALGALMNLARPEDAALIVGALEKTPTSNVRLAAAFAGSTALESAASPDERLIAALEKVAFDDTAEPDERRSAVSAVGRTRSVAATDTLLRMSRIADLGLQARAALHLLHSDLRAHRAYVEEIVHRWPIDAPYPASEVIELLSESVPTGSP
jgi:HEAT repeat protein